jgi:hypothetical protein
MEDLGAPVVKIFAQGDSFPRVDVALRAARNLVVLRHYELSRNWGVRGFTDRKSALDMAAGHASYWRKLLTNVPQHEKIAVEGLNEPEVHPWGSEPPELTGAYYAELARLLSSSGVRVVTGNLSVGWPGNGEPEMPPASPPIWKPYTEMVEATLRYNGFLGLHEYWYFNGPKEPVVEGTKKSGGWGWWAGRFRTCPWNVPIIITEAGIGEDVLHEGKKIGWLGLPPPMDITYIRQVVDYDIQCILDGRVVGFTLFLHDYYDKEWEWYNTRVQGFMDLWMEHMRDVENGEYSVLPPAWPMPQWSSLPWTPSPGTTPAPTPIPVVDPIRVLMPDGAVQVLALEEYLRYVVGAEVPALWPVEAVKAQAVAARSYARVAMASPRHGASADVCTKQHCQVFNPAKVHPASDAAIKATAGEVILYDGKVATAFFSANCGGVTMGNETAFGGVALPYLRPVPCINPGPKNGHGVGMCQWGAHDMADAGADYKTILKHYYTGVRLSSEPEPVPPPVDDTDEIIQLRGAIADALPRLEALHTSIGAVVAILKAA